MGSNPFIVQQCKFHLLPKETSITPSNLGQIWKSMAVSKSAVTPAPSVNVAKEGLSDESDDVINDKDEKKETSVENLEFIDENDNDMMVCLSQYEKIRQENVRAQQELLQDMQNAKNYLHSPQKKKKDERKLSSAGHDTCN